MDECFTGYACVIQGQTFTPYGIYEYCTPACPGASWKLSVINPPPGATVTFNPDIVPVNTSTEMTVSTSATTPVDLYALDVHSTPIGNSPTQSDLVGPVEVGCSNSLNTCPKVQIVDQNGKGTPVVSGSPPPVTSTVVGRQANLLARQAPGSGRGTYGALNTIQWAIPGGTVKSYNRDGAMPVVLAPSDLTNASIAYYWVAGGSERPSITGKLTRSDGHEIADVQTQANFTVNVPVSTGSALTPNPIRVGSRSDFTGVFLTWGDKANPGIDFSFAVTNTFGFPGNISGTQLINRTYVNDGTATHATMGMSWLDNFVDYEEPVPTGTPWTAIDAPGLNLIATHTTTSISDQFQMYYLYKPTDHGIWVTLRVVDWAWTASAQRTGSPNVWCLGGAAGCPDVVKPTSTQNPSATISTVLPSWMGTYVNTTAQSTRKPRRSNITPLPF